MEGCAVSHHPWRGAVIHTMRRWISRIYTSRWLNIGCRLLLAAVFIRAGVGKILRPEDFANATAGYRILPMELINIFAVVMPWVEVLAGIAVLPRVTASSGAFVLLGLNLVFIVAIGSAIARGLHVECGCFSSCSTDSSIGWWLILRDLGLVLTCLPVVWNPRA